MLDEVYVRIAENMKVKRPIEDTRTRRSRSSLVLAQEIDFRYVILVNLPNIEYLYNYIIVIVFYKGAMNIAASIRSILELILE